MRSTGVLDLLGPTAGLSHGTVLFVDDEELLRATSARSISSGPATPCCWPTAPLTRLSMCGPTTARSTSWPPTSACRERPDPCWRKRREKIFPDVQLIYMSGYPHYSVGQQAIPFSEAGYLQKPFALDELVALVDRLLASGA